MELFKSSFGMLMPGRTFAAQSSYRYGFNGKANDNEVKGEGNQQDYGMRIYDPRLGRFLSTDPLTSSYPFYSPYQFSGNMPIVAIDLDGLEEYVVINYYSRERRLMERSIIRVVDKTKPNENINMQLQTSQNRPATTEKVLVRNVFLDNTEVNVYNDDHKKGLSTEELNVLKHGVLASTGTKQKYFISVEEGENLHSLKDDYNSTEYDLIERVMKYNVRAKVDKSYRVILYDDPEGDGKRNTGKVQDYVTPSLMSKFKKEFPHATGSTVESATITIKSENDRGNAEQLRASVLKTFPKAKIFIKTDPTFQSEDRPSPNDPKKVYKASEHDVKVEIKIAATDLKNPHN
jgi:RHS repeat-associated protein